MRHVRHQINFMLVAATATILCGGKSALAVDPPALSPASITTTGLVAPLPIASPAAIVRSISAGTDAGATFLDIALDGPTLPAVAYSGTAVTVSLSHAKAAQTLAEHISTGGLVNRIAFDPGQSDQNNALVRVALNEASEASLVPGPDARTIRVRIAPATSVEPAAVIPSVATQTAATPPPAAVSASQSGPQTYSFDAYDSDVTSLLKSLATQSGVDIAFTGAVTGKATVHLSNATVDHAVDILTKSAGLSYYRDGNTYYIGTPKDLSTAFPTLLASYATSQQIYECRYVVASDLATSLASVFDRNLLHVTLGAGAVSPHLDGSQAVGQSPPSASSSSGSSGSYPSSGASGSSSGTSAAVVGNSSSSGSSAGGSGPTTRTIILTGETNTVTQAMALAEKLDIRRKQVRIDVHITDITTAALKDLGLQWTFSNYTVSERTPAQLGTVALSGIIPGTLTHSPLSFDATIAALEQTNAAKLLAAPSMSLLDGEKGSILIGTRVLYPVLVGYTQAQTPIYDKAEEPVGIYMQVAAQMAGDNEITLTIYPQVSFITSYLTVNGASYPQISTREQQTTVRVKDGEKIIIGGLISEQDIQESENVPILSSLPFFGELFKHRKTTKDRDEVIILITPTVLPD